jgi:hypothetical protein
VAGQDFGYRPFMAVVLAALALSPVSLYHYRAAAWWGRPVQVRVALVRVDGDWAAAKITAPTGTQWVLVHRGKVVTWVVGKATRFYCHTAPPRVIPQLVGGCQIYGRYQDDVEIVGPTARRRVQGRFRGCRAPLIFASRVDPSYEEVDNCAVSGGSYFLHHGRIVQEEIDGPGCDWAPPGVIRSLHGRCLLVP